MSGFETCSEIESNLVFCPSGKPQSGIRGQVSEPDSFVSVALSNEWDQDFAGL